MRDIEADRTEWLSGDYIPREVVADQIVCEAELRSMPEWIFDSISGGYRRKGGVQHREQLQRDVDTWRGRVVGWQSILATAEKALDDARANLRHAEDARASGAACGEVTALSGEIECRT